MPLSETTCVGCGIRFTPKYPAPLKRDPNRRFHSSGCAARHHLLSLDRAELDRRRWIGIRKAAGKARAKTVQKWSETARRLVKTALIDVRADLTERDCEPLVRALVMELRRNYHFGYRVAYNRAKRDQERLAS